MNKIPERLRILREERKLTRYQLSKLLGKGSNTIYRWEAGEKTLNADNIIMLCKFFNCSADFLLGLVDE